MKIATEVQILLIVAGVAVILFVVVGLEGIFAPITWTTHIGGHVCEVMRSGWSRSISCNFNK